MHIPKLTFPKKSNEILPFLRQRNAKQTGNDFVPRRKSQIRETLRNRLRYLQNTNKNTNNKSLSPVNICLSWSREKGKYERESFKSQILSYNRYLLPMMIRSKNLRTITNHEHSEIGIKESKQVFSIWNNIPSWMSIRRERANLFDVCDGNN